MTPQPDEPVIDFGLPVPDGFDTPEFREEWLAFCEHRVGLSKAKGKKIPWTEIAAKAALRKLAKFDVEIATEALQNSILAGWQGVFPEGVKRTASPNRTSLRRHNVVDPSRFPE